MSFKDILFHPMFVHFPIALCFFEVFLLSLARLKKNAAYLLFARLTFRVLAVCLTLTLVTGWKDAGGTFAALFQGGVKPHFYAACCLTVLVLIRLVGWKIYAPDHPRCLAVQGLGAIVQSAAVVVTAYWGGKLVYG